MEMVQKLNGFTNMTLCHLLQLIFQSYTSKDSQINVRDSKMYLDKL